MSKTKPSCVLMSVQKFWSWVFNPKHLCLVLVFYEIIVGLDSLVLTPKFIWTIFLLLWNWEYLLYLKNKIKLLIWVTSFFRELEHFWLESLVSHDYVRTLLNNSFSKNLIFFFNAGIKKPQFEGAINILLLMRAKLRNTWPAPQSTV